MRIVTENDHTYIGITGPGDTHVAHTDDEPLKSLTIEVESA